MIGKRQNIWKLESLSDVRAATHQSGECWLWSGARSKDGHGKVGSLPAHHSVWILVNGPIPSGEEVVQTCNRSGCVRPDHLRLKGATPPHDTRVEHRHQVRVRERGLVSSRAKGKCEICGGPETYSMERSHIFGRGTKGIICDELADQAELSVWAHKPCHMKLDANKMPERQMEMRWNGVRRLLDRFSLTLPSEDVEPRLAMRWIEDELRRQGKLVHLAGRGWELRD